MLPSLLKAMLAQGPPPAESRRSGGTKETILWYSGRDSPDPMPSTGQWSQAELSWQRRLQRGQAKACLRISELLSDWFASVSDWALIRRLRLPSVLCQRQALALVSEVYSDQRLLTPLRRLSF